MERRSGNIAAVHCRRLVRITDSEDFVQSSQDGVEFCLLLLEAIPDYIR